MATPGDGYVFAAGDGERLVFGGGTVVIKAATEEFTIWEELPPLLDTPLHVHEREDEIFQILDGKHVFQCGGASVSRGSESAARNCRSGGGAVGL